MSEVDTAPSRGELFVHPHPVDVLLKPEQFEAFYAEIVKETKALVPDTMTEKGRNAIKRTAFKITKTRTFLDAIGKKLNEEARSQIGKVDEARRHMREKLEGLQDEVRAPLTQWEAAEEARAERMTRTMDYFRQIVNVNDTPSRLAEELAKVKAVELEPIFGSGDEAPFAERAKEDAIQALSAKLEQAKKDEADREELYRLRQQAAQRDEDERKAREAVEQHEREETAQRAAADAAKREAEARAAAALATMEAAHQAELRKEQAERERLEQADRDRQAEEAQRAEERRLREADREHRANVILAAEKALMTLGLGQATAKKIVHAIMAGEIPNVAMGF